MEMQNSQIEIVLFYIADKENAIESILSGFQMNRQVKPEKMLDLCVQSIKKNMPHAKIVLVTDHNTYIHSGIENLEVIKTGKIQHESLIFDLTKFRRDYVASKMGECDTNLIFTDIDVLINKNLIDVFLDDFDFATTIEPTNNPSLNKRGLPIGGMMFNFTGGIYFVRCNQNTLNFYDHVIDLWEYFFNTESFNNYGKLSEYTKNNFLKWWGELHTLSVIFGLDVLTGKCDYLEFNKTSLRFFPEKKYNFAPDYKIEGETLHVSPFTLDQITVASMIHFRGVRKLFMQVVFDKIF